jgi:K+-transporting ATPase ATPase B chain
MTALAHARPLFDPPLVKVAIKDSFIKLAPWVQWRNPVMFVVLVGSVLISGLWLAQLRGGLPSEGRPGFVLAIALWLWATLLFANFAESLAEGRGKAQAAALRSSKRDVPARRLPTAAPISPRRPCPRASCGAAMSCWSRPATRFPVTARSSGARPRWTRVRSPASRHR